jgi:predicted ATPase/DNA-binding SARP family transcriptional activator
MEFRMLGSLEVYADAGPVALGGARLRGLLALLLLHRNEPMSAERLAVALWGEDAPAGAVKGIQVHVSRLRRALGDPDVLTTTPAGYRLRVAPDELDCERFERLSAEGFRALADREPARAGRVLREALSLWRGPALAEFAFEAFAQAEIGRLEEERLAALEARVEADLAVGRHGELVGELQQLVAIHPLRERLYGQLMLSLYRSGRQADALKTFRDARDVLVEQLGIEPGPELREVERAVLAHDPGLDSGSRSSRVEGADERAMAARIPAPPTATIGREADLAGLRDLVGESASRLVTVVGPGGVGKTRLALELARGVGERFADGARFVGLAPVSAPEHVASTIAHRLDVVLLPSESAEDGLARHLGERELLLVLDNFEHVLAAAPLVADLLAATTKLRVLVTSREPLRLRAERLFRLDPLALPPSEVNGDGTSVEQAPAVELFVAVARARDASFALSDDNASAVAGVCRRLDGLPLALELAAASIGLLTVPELAVRLREGLDALGSGPRDAPARQRTLTATLEWSYTLLTPDEQAALARLAVFAGGCTLDAAQDVTGTSLDVLEALVSKNLAVAERTPSGSVRLGMLETVREFARGRFEQREDTAELHRRHCEQYLALAERARPELRRSGSPDLLAEFDHELNNFRGAITWALNHPAPSLALRLASSLRFYMERRRLEREASNWLAAALALDVDAVPQALRAAALDAYAHTLIETRTIDKAEAVAREGLDLWRSIGDRTGCAASMNSLCHVLLWVHRDDEAYRYAREAERLARESGDEQALVDALHNQAGLAPTLEQNLALGELAAAADRAAGNQWRLAELQSDLSYTAIIHGDHALAQQLGKEAVDAAAALDEPVLLAYALGNSGLAEVFSRDTDRARAAFSQQLRLIRRHRHHKLVYEPLIGLAAVAATEERDDIAATLHGAADAATLERPHPSVARQLEERCFAPARSRLGQQSWQAAYAAGAGLDGDQAIEVALGNAPTYV